MHGIVLCLNRKASACDVDVSERVVFIVFAMESVLTGSDGEISVCNRQTVLRLNGMISGSDFIGSGRNRHLVLPRNSVLRGRRDDQFSDSVQGEIVFGKYDGIHIVLILVPERAPVFQSVHGSVCKGKEHLIGLQDVYCREIGRGDVRSA